MTALQRGTKKPTSIKARLIAMVLAIKLPAVAIAVGSAVLLWQSGQALTEQHLLRHAQALSSVVAMQIEREESALRTLANSRSLEAGDLDRFQQHLVRAEKDDGADIILFDKMGRALVSSAAPLQDFIPSRSDPAISQRVFETGQPQLSVQKFSSISDQRAIFIDVPVRRDGKVIYDLAMAIPDRVLSHLLTEQRPHNGEWAAAILDSNESLISQSPESGDFAFDPALFRSGSIIPKTHGDGTLTTRSIVNQPLVTGFSRVRGAGWTVLVATGQSDIAVILWRNLCWMGAAGGLLLAAGTLGALLQGHRIARSVQALRTVPVGGEASGILEVQQVAQALASASADRSRAELALRDSEAHFRAITDIIPHMVWSARADGYHDYFNQRWYDVTGAAPHDTLGSGWLSLCHPDDRVAVEAKWQQALHTSGSFEIEHRLRVADDTYRWMLARAIAVSDTEAGKITRWFGTFTDIQESVAAKEILRNYRNELERQVAERTRKLEETQSRLVQAQRLEALGQLAGGIAHDINNVLQSIHGCLSLIERRAEDAGKVRSLARMSLQAVTRGAGVTGRLLTFSRRGALRAQAVSAPDLLTNMKELLEHSLGAGIDIRLELDPDLPLILADKDQLETVLINLATNGRDAMAGHGTLCLSARFDADPRCTLRLAPGRHHAGFLLVSVSDTGSGMDPVTLSRAMDPFFTTKPQGLGTGLGLAMVRGFAEQSGGGLEIASSVGVGTTVNLWLPAASQHDKAPETSRSALADFTGRGRVLLVDDDDSVREVLAEQLSAIGYTVQEAATGGEALTFVGSGEPIDAVVSDLSMPGMDGLTLIRELQQHRPGLPALLLTGFVADTAEIAVVGASTDSFSLLRKPIDIVQLAERLDGLLQKAPALA